MNSSEGMRLAQNQPPSAGFSLRHNVLDPARQRLGIVKMLVGSNQLKHDRRTGVRMQLEVRDRADHPNVKAAFVCLHPTCSGKSWKTEDELVADHPKHEEMVNAGEVHVIGWYSEAQLDAKQEGIEAEQLVERAKASVKACEKQLLEAKDDKSMNDALERLELAKRNVAGLTKLADERKAKIVGFLSDERPGR